MDKITIDISRFKVKSKITNERQLVIKDFLDKLNLDRGTYKPLTARAVAIKLSHLSLDELKGFYGQCKNAKHFGKYFWWSLRIDK